MLPNPDTNMKTSGAVPQYQPMKAKNTRLAMRLKTTITGLIWNAEMSEPTMDLGTN